MHEIALALSEPTLDLVHQIIPDSTSTEPWLHEESEYAARAARRVERAIPPTGRGLVRTQDKTHSSPPELRDERVTAVFPNLAQEMRRMGSTPAFRGDDQLERVERCLLFEEREQSSLKERAIR